MPEQGEHVRLKNVVWTRPITVGSQSLEVHIRLFAEQRSAEAESASISFEIYTRQSGGSLDDVELHGQGMAVAVVSSEPSPWIWKAYGRQWMEACERGPVLSSFPDDGA